MDWLIPRLLIAAVTALVVGFIGALLAQSPVMGALAGLAAGFGAIAIRDTLRGYRLIEWLRGSLDAPAPRDAGLWGELGYRIERAVRSREQSAERER